MKAYLEHFQTLWSNTLQILVALALDNSSKSLNWLCQCKSRSIPCSLHICSCNICTKHNVPSCQSCQSYQPCHTCHMFSKFSVKPTATWALDSCHGASSREYSRNSETYLRKDREPSSKMLLCVFCTLKLPWNWCWHLSWQSKVKKYLVGFVWK